MPWITSKLDWLPNDYINYEDFNRIENNLQEVASYLNSIQYSIPEMTVVTNRSYSSIDFVSSINRIEQNIETIRQNFITPTGYGFSKTWSIGKTFDYNDAIRLEMNLELLINLGLLVFESFVYCGNFLCGQTFVLPQAIKFAKFIEIESLTFNALEKYSMDEVEKI